METAGIICFVQAGLAVVFMFYTMATGDPLEDGISAKVLLAGATAMALLIAAGIFMEVAGHEHVTQCADRCVGDEVMLRCDDGKALCITGVVR